MAAGLSAHREVPKRAPDAALRRVLERRRVKIGQMPGRAVVRPAEANLNLAGPLKVTNCCDRARIVGGGDRRAEPADRAVLVAPDAGRRPWSPAPGGRIRHRRRSGARVCLRPCSRIGASPARPPKAGAAEAISAANAARRREVRDMSLGWLSSCELRRYRACYDARKVQHIRLLRESGEIFATLPSVGTQASDRRRLGPRVAMPL